MQAKRRKTLLGSVAALAGLSTDRRVAAQQADGGHAHEAPSPPPATEGAPRAAERRAPAPADAYVYIGWPLDRQIMYGTRFKVWFGTRNFGVAPAGVAKVNTGHHHLLVDTDLPPLDQEIPNDRKHLHFGRGQTETILELPPGTHTLQLLMGDENHVPHDPPVISKRITIIVRAGRQGASVASATQ
jgi:hypothetical protein